MKSTTTSSPCLTDSWTIDFTRRTYREEIRKKGTEPQNRSLCLVSHFSHLKWHVKVTFQGTLQSAQTATFARVTKRREDLENLCLCIDFDLIQLFDDTVTELIVTRQHDATTQGQRLRLKTALDAESEYTLIVDYLWLCIREDPLRVRFPVYNGSDGGTPTKDLSEIRITQELSGGVYKAHVDSDEKPYVYKEVDRPLYEPRDSEALEQELRNLEWFRGTESVVWLVAAVVSKNPYQTAETIKDDTPTVLRGILLEYHPNGTLLDALQSPKPKTGWPWQRWAVQIACALAHLHQVGVTHMDLKPRNIVISADFNAILIDISGSGGVTHEWLSPEMRNLPDPLSQNTESRIQNDIWALGNMLSVMADVSCNDMEKQLLRNVALDATAKVPLRISLHDAISKLSRLSSE